MGDVTLYHRPCLVRHDKWAHIPAPIAIKEHISREYFLEFAACRCFTDTRRAAYDYQVFHKADYRTGELRIAIGLLAVMEPRNPRPPRTGAPTVPAEIR